MGDSFSFEPEKKYHPEVCVIQGVIFNVTRSSTDAALYL